MMHPSPVSVVLHAVEALPGLGRYAVTFRGTAGTEQRAVAHVHDGDVDSELDIADASLPDGWHRGGEQFAAMTAAVLALHHAHSLTPSAGALTDVDGGWDVSLGNVVLADGVPTCTADGALDDLGGGRFECSTCGAAALYQE